MRAGVQLTSAILSNNNHFDTLWYDDGYDERRPNPPFPPKPGMPRCESGEDRCLRSLKTQPKSFQSLIDKKKSLPEIE